MSRESTGAHGGWSAVVYGRTYRIDRWWRALPEGVEGATPGGPLGRTVLAVVSGGTRLDAGPRFVLDRGAHGVLVGAACRMPLLGPEMAYDEHGRPLYGFVGWHHPDRAAPHDLPGLGELEASFPHWAAATYRAWAGPVWDVAREPDAVTLPSTPEPAPWTQYVRPADPAAALRWPPAHPADVHLLPAEQAAGLWDAALAAGPMADCVLTTGWRQSRDAREPGLTHSCCADVGEYRRAPHTAPPTPARAADPAPKPGRPPREKEGKSFLARMGDVLRSAIDGDRPGDRPRPAARTRPAPQRGTARRPYLTGSAAYEPPEPPAPGLLARAHAVDAEQASFEGYFGALGTPPPDSAPAPGPGPGPGATPAPGGPAGRDAGSAAPSGPGSSGSRAVGDGPRTAPGPGGVLGAGWPSATEGPGATAAPGGRASRDAGTAAPSGPGGGPGVTPGPGGPAGCDAGTAAPSGPGSSGSRPAGDGPRTAPGPGATPAPGGAAGRNGGTAAASGRAGWPSAPGGPGAIAAPGGSGSRGAAADPPTGPGQGMTPAAGAAAQGGDAGAVGPRTASGPDALARPGTTAAVDAAAGPRTGEAGTPAPGGSAGAWGVLTPDADGWAGRDRTAPDDPEPDDTNRSHPGGSA
ncbi:hypothetical protein [Streptomyces erythrochromogenes]|uniref:hypothetical protein n=1 Tax=Streptomyces erythrochromogenes TaxID=285574 RepID=UPI0036BECDE8